MQSLPSVAVVIPASGIGKRMNSSIPKQYLTIFNQSILEHTVNLFIALPYVSKIIVVVAEEDDYIDKQNFISHHKIVLTAGGKERGNSVFNGVKALNDETEWVLVHDAARPCVKQEDIKSLVNYCVTHERNAILATPVRDTMKRVFGNKVTETVERQDLYHALTPQCCKVTDLKNALSQLLDQDSALDSRVTDEASALELCGIEVDAVVGSQTNIKVTQFEDLALAEFYLKGER